jgi:amino acid adenylation domain-containing protein
MTAGPASPSINVAGHAGEPFISFPASAMGGTIAERFVAVAKANAERPALQDMTRAMTYGELARQVERIASATAAATKDRPGLVATLLAHDISFPAALLGVLASGRAIAPLDASHPAERNRRIADHAQVAAVISTRQFADEAHSLFASDPNVIVLDAIDDAPPPAEPSGTPDDLAYVYYTSGSTGAPNGVRHSHLNGVFDAWQNTHFCRFSREDRFALLYSGAVIGGLRNILFALLNGASLHILPPVELGPDGLIREIRARRITVLPAVPAVLRRIFAATPPDEPLDSVRMVRTGGDRMDWSDFDALRRAAPGARFHMAIGSTECCSSYAQWTVEDLVDGRGLRLPVGREVPGVELAILDDDGDPVPDGEIGQFVVSSRYLAQGYWREPRLTRERFSAHPSDPSARVFKTGDMGRRRADGLYEFVGRKDQLIKLRGHRIEPTDVEAALRAAPGVADAAVVVRRLASGAAKTMVAYAELLPGVKGLLPRHLKSMISQQLPVHMHPSIFFIVEALPRLANLKLDRMALDRLDAERAGNVTDRKADACVDEVARAFERVLSCDAATPDDNLLSLGGDSLQAVDMTLELERRFGVRISAEAFGEFPDIRSLAAWISDRRPWRAPLSTHRA